MRELTSIKVGFEGAGGTTHRTVIVGGRRFRCESRDCGEFMSPWVESGPGRPLLPEG